MRASLYLSGDSSLNEPTREFSLPEKRLLLSGVQRALRDVMKFNNGPGSYTQLPTSMSGPLGHFGGRGVFGGRVAIPSVDTTPAGGNPKHPRRGKQACYFRGGLGAISPLPPPS